MSDCYHLSMKPKTRDLIMKIIAVGFILIMIFSGFVVIFR